MDENSASAAAEQLMDDIRELMNQINEHEGKSLQKHLSLARLLEALKTYAPRGQFGACCKNALQSKSASWCARLMKAAKFVDSTDYRIAVDWLRSRGGEEPLTIDQIHKLRLMWEENQRGDEGPDEDARPKRKRKPDDLAVQCSELLAENGRLIVENQTLQTQNRFQQRRIRVLELRLAQTVAGEFVQPEPLLLTYAEGAAMTL